MEIPLTENSLQMLYGSSFYLIPGDAPEMEAKAVQEEKKAESAPIEQKPSLEAPKEMPKQETAAPKDLPKQETAAPQKPGITWRTKPSSKVLFVIRAEEWADKALLELLKKIVASIGLPFEMAGFGIISGPVAPAEFEGMPNPFAVVFDNSLFGGSQNPMSMNGNEVFFSHLLGSLEAEKALKVELWNYLKVLKDKIG